MPRLRVHSMSISLDGFAAGPDQGPDDPLGVGGEQLHAWFFATRTFRSSIGMSGGDAGTLDDQVARTGFEGIGATIMGRNMFGPVRGEWPDTTWRGWWGESPPFDHPVFVLTHHPREPIEMDNDTTFHFVTDGIDAALDRAMRAADGQDVRLGGGAATVRQYLRAGLIDECHLAVSPVLLGRGEPLLSDPDLTRLYRVDHVQHGEAAVHYHLERRSS